jgi:hypothetical protein
VQDNSSVCLTRELVELVLGAEAGQLRMAHTFVDASERDLAIHVLRQAVEVAGSPSTDTVFLFKQMLSSQKGNHEATQWAE